METITMKIFHAFLEQSFFIHIIFGFCHIRGFWRNSQVLFSQLQISFFSFIYLAACVLLEARGLSCPVACEILVLQPEKEYPFPVLESRFLTTGPPGKSEGYRFLSSFFFFKIYPLRFNRPQTYHSFQCEAIHIANTKYSLWKAKIKLQC